MINRLEMATENEIRASFPLLSDGQIQNNLREKIEDACKSIKRTIHLGADVMAEHTLFSITAAEESLLKDKDYAKGAIGRVETDRLERLGFEIMKEYGLNESISRPTCGKFRGWSDAGEFNGLVGAPEMSREMRTYPSQTIKGLAFVRTKDFVTATGKIKSVYWTVEDKAPFFGINLNKKIKAKIPAPAI